MKFPVQVIYIGRAQKSSVEKQRNEMGKGTLWLKKCDIKCHTWCGELLEME